MIALVRLTRLSLICSLKIVYNNIEVVKCANCGAMRKSRIVYFVFGMLMKIIARNLARETTQAELTALFAEFGLVESCTLVLDKATGKSKGFCFVEMPKHIEAKTAIKRLNAKKVGGSVIRVKVAEEVAPK